jgi:dipeptidyl aminopeptidase/acylaminoacyl peptidase
MPVTAGNERLEKTLATLDRVRYPVDLSFHYSGDALAVALFPPHYEQGSSFQSRIWRVALDGSAIEQLTFGPRTDSLPRWSPTNERLAFASERPVAGRMSPFIVSPGEDPQQLGDIEGSVQEIAWARDGRSLLVLAVDEGGFGAATDGAVRLRWSEAPDPSVFRPDQGWRRLLKVDVETGVTEEVGPPAVTVWEFDIVDDSTAVALVSDDPSENGWYRARLALLDLDNRTLHDLWIPDRQIQGPAVNPTGAVVAILEGW